MSLTRFVAILTASVAGFAAASSAAEFSSTSSVSLASDLGIVPESLAIAGVVSSNDVAEIFGNLDEASTLRGDYETALLTLDTACTSLAELAGIVLIDPDAEGVSEQYELAALAVAAAEQDVSNARQALLEAALDDLPGTVLEKIQMWQASAHCTVPAEFRVLDRTETQWNEIECALRAERRALYFDTSLDTNHAQLLSAVREDTAVAAAASALTVNLAGLEALFAQQAGG